MTLKAILLILFIIICLFSDMLFCKIKNIVTLFFAVAGILANCFFYGKDGFVQSVMGCFVPVAALFPMFVLRMLGAGDVKLFGAVGAIMGVEFSVCSALYSFLYGGIIAVVLLAAGQNAAERFRYLFAYLKVCFLTCSLQEYTAFDKLEKNARFRFCYAVALAVLTQFLLTFARI